MNGTRYMKEIQPIQLAGCLITDIDGRFLLLRRRVPNWWEVPGGKVQPAETAASAAAREMREELEVGVGGLQRIGEARFTYNGRRYNYVYFHAGMVEGRPLIAEPHLFHGVGYHALRQVAGLELSPAAAALRKQIVDGEIRVPENIV